MAWATFPYPDRHFLYSPAGLKRAWHGLHAGDAEAWPRSAALVEAWIAFHAGDFEAAAGAGLALGLPGYAVAHKAACIHAAYLDASSKSRCRRWLEVAARCEAQQEQQPDVAAGFYWHAYALGRYAQEISVLTALAQGTAAKVKASLDRTLALAPGHADAHIALGVYHAEIIAKTGALIGGLTYGVSHKQALAHFGRALELNPDSVIARVEYARGLVLLDGSRHAEQARRLLQAAAASTAHDAMERLDLERARQELGA